MPSASPSTAQVVVPAVVQVFPPGFEVTVYPVIGEPPVLVGGTQITITRWKPGITRVIDGGPGTMAGGPAGHAPGALLSPTGLLFPTGLTHPTGLSQPTGL